MAPDSRYIIGISVSRVALASIISVALKRNLLQDGGNATDMVEMVVADEEIVNVLDTQLIQV